MGGTKSTDTYTRLGPSSYSPLAQPLLRTNQVQCMDEIKYNIKDNDNTSVESKIREFKAAVARFESRAQTVQYNNNVTTPPSLQLQPLAINDNNEQSDLEIENEVHEFKALVKVLHQIMKKQEEAIASLREKNTALEEQISKLATITYDMKAERDTEDPITITRPTVNYVLGCLVALIFLLSILIGLHL
ncbi:uncharacterized protein LOC123193384 isoform X4 [Mangifera indica]|uniref:uncharacterized protein LOC123193384 isoform X4 n=1 Tax=Mangifera indica TaxID=29780 RepID=UPI001CFA3757|nr:uncharacterized protein LOC123193384 isoform X4 [Mangifera indica]XP_044462281.1 uncharacterized protein LOC123193384 isoform X4 [Mangifera indica]